MINIGYVRISQPTQKIERQVQNIQARYGKEIKIYEEIFTGTKIEGRKRFNQMVKDVIELITNGHQVKIIFDSVSRMSRNKQEGVDTYFKLFNMGVELEFIKEPHINTIEYRKALNRKIVIDGINIDDESLAKYIKGNIELTNKLIIDMATRNIILAFEQAEKEVSDLHERTKEGMRVKKEVYGIIPGPKKGTKMPRKNKEEKKSIIKEHSRAFGGSLKDKEVMKLCDLSHDAYYRYKKELYEELAVEVEAV